MIIARFLRQLLRHTSAAGLTALLCITLAATSYADNERKLLVLGDSISAAYGMDLEQGWAAHLQQRLRSEHPGWLVVNASISGDTTGGGLQRLPALLQQHTPELVLIELGGNDGLRGYPIGQLRANLAEMTQLAQDAGADVMLLAMEIPPNFGRRYTQMFRDSFTVVAQQTGASATPFILEGIATEKHLMQADGIHPTAEAQAAISDNIWQYLRPLILQRTAAADIDNTKD